jgi:LPXTG-motif cell wall-anchored protein
MDNVTLIRVIAGVGALIVLGIIIWRRKRQTTD